MATTSTEDRLSADHVHQPEDGVEYRVNMTEDRDSWQQPMFLFVCCRAEAERLTKKPRTWPNGKPRRWIERRNVGPWSPPVTADHTPERLSAGRRVAVNGSPGGTIAWSEHVEAWEAYHRMHPGQDAETIAVRGGFGLVELLWQLGHMPVTWEPGTEAQRQFHRSGATFAPVILAAHLADVEARLAAVEVEHRVIHQAGSELVCFCGVHLSVYGLTQSPASVFAQHVRSSRALHPDKSEVARDE